MRNCAKLHSLRLLRVYSAHLFTRVYIIIRVSACRYVTTDIFMLCSNIHDHTHTRSHFLSLSLSLPLPFPSPSPFITFSLYFSISISHTLTHSHTHTFMRTNTHTLTHTNAPIFIFLEIDGTVKVYKRHGIKIETFL